MFQHILSAFPKLSFEKIKAGVFDGLQISTFVRDEELVKKMKDKEKATWLSFVAVTRNFSGNNKADNYQVLVTAMLLAFHDFKSVVGFSLVSNRFVYIPIFTTVVGMVSQSVSSD